MGTSRPAVAIPLTIVCTIAAASGAMLATPLFNLSSPLAQPAAGLAVALIAVLLVYLWRRYLLHRPWSGVGLPWRRSAIPEAFLGAVIAAAAVMVANTVSVLVGAATWTSGLEPGEDFGYGVLAILSVSIVQQGFPEELLWRGHLYDLLSDSFSQRTVLVLTSVTFGLLHVITGGAGSIAGLLRIAMAMALGFACGAARVRTGAAWMAVGVHSGFHLGLRGLPTDPSNDAVLFILLTVTLALAGLLILGRALVRAAQPAPEGHDAVVDQ
jgi:membrane protease YdiL (CAAX protease family)